MTPETTIKIGVHVSMPVIYGRMRWPGNAIVVDCYQPLPNWFQRWMWRLFFGVVYEPQTGAGNDVPRDGLATERLRAAMADRMGER